LEEGKGKGYLASSRRYGNVLLEVRHQEEEETIIQIVTGVEVIIGNCFPDVWEILPDAIKVSLNAVRNIYKIRNLSISQELFHILTRDMRLKHKTMIWICQSSGSNCCLEKSN